MMSRTERITEDYRLTSLTVPNTLSWTLGYNADDDITGITDNLVGSNSQTLGYDNLNHLGDPITHWNASVGIPDWICGELDCGHYECWGRKAWTKRLNSCALPVSA